ncbi:RNA methyltransferase substrate-binding domain-containing protein [Eggerthella sinensis]|uniref:RNA methyltransferase substrate-binding domain-containing protein n=1 Tax=Eggerthella sinensis TaxID=242230 RepID=UPI0022E18CF8|nr:RNA methyltransferase substrate-binding domain-containing protein [Eggerthella sinensis]
MADFIEGKRPVIEALRTGVPIKSVLMADNVQRDGLIEDILRKAKRVGATVEMVPRKVLDGKSERGSHQASWRRRHRFRTWASATWWMPPASTPSSTKAARS